MTNPTQLPTWLARVPLQATWTGWRTMQNLAHQTGYWHP